MSSNTSASPEPAVASVTQSATKARSTRKPASAKKPAVTKVKAATKPKSTKTTTKSTVTKARAATSSHPSWKQIVTVSPLPTQAPPPLHTILNSDPQQECIAANREDARQGVSRSTIKKYAEEKYHLKSTAANTYQLGRAITTGAEAGIFSLPKGPSGKVKLAPKVKTATGAKENSKPPSKVAAKPASKPAATTKKPAAKPATKSAAAKPAATKNITAPVKKTLAGKAKAAPAKKTAVASKRGAAKKVG
ncbi:hypothetical protein H0H81_010822 [Sphagnurus paluster]|uniref:Histone H1 n=1 Tax=Sphagnurus paluster TaxID=117069 RepID=A0A9P7FYI5_9AGAR|nr:hypothetical protein H0H81_010822 [Sphagnurus paluster]